jgi:hypothetical protein
MAVESVVLEARVQLLDSQRAQDVRWLHDALLLIEVAFSHRSALRRFSDRPDPSLLQAFLVAEFRLLCKGPLALPRLVSSKV